MQTQADGILDRIAHGSHRRDDLDLAHAAGAKRVAGGGDFHQSRLYHRQIGRDRAAIVEEARIVHLAVLIVDVLLVQGPADALHGTALDLAFHVTRVDGTADVLDGSVTHDSDLTGLVVHLDIRDVDTEART